jgi:hypothetical protein
MSAFLKLHERLIIIVLCLLVGGFLIYKYLSHEASVADKKSLQADAVLAQQTTINNQLAVQVKQQEDTLTALVVQVSQENAQLVNAIQNRTQTTIVQQKADKTLPLPDLATRWENLAGLQSTDITATESGLSVSDAGSRLTVQALENVPTLTANLADSQNIIANKDQQITSLNEFQGTLQDQVKGLNTQIGDADKACKATVASVKADARKSKMKWFLTGIGIGIGGGVAIMAKLL